MITDNKKVSQRNRRLIKYYQRYLGYGGVMSNSYPFWLPCRTDAEAKEYIKKLAAEAKEKAPFDWCSISKENEYVD